MKSTGKGVSGLLLKLQEEVLGYSVVVVVPMHANCHRADLEFRDTMDSTHEFLEAMADTMTAVVANNHPQATRK